MPAFKLTAGETFPELTVSGIEGDDVNLAKPTAPNDWKLVVVYRGNHCPTCAKYLTQLKEVTDKLTNLNVDLVGVSADPREKFKDQMSIIKPT